MNLSNMNVDVFFSCVREVERKLLDNEEMSRLLNEAREMPIINGILRELALLLAQKPRREYRNVIAIAKRDLVVFLALRAIERRQRSVEMARLN